MRHGKPDRDPRRRRDRGSFRGSWIFGLLGIVALGGLGYWVMAIVGAMVLIAILRAFGVFK